LTAGIAFACVGVVILIATSVLWIWWIHKMKQGK
jgi:hypothetical protein